MIIVAEDSRSRKNSLLPKQPATSQKVGATFEWQLFKGNPNTYWGEPPCNTPTFCEVAATVHLTFKAGLKLLKWTNWREKGLIVF
jgi:hypothetical protein